MENKVKPSPHVVMMREYQYLNEEQRLQVADQIKDFDAKAPGIYVLMDPGDGGVMKSVTLS